MKRSLYPRLAWQGIRKNGKIYFPYLAASIFVVMVYYLIGFLSNDPVVREMEGGEQMQLILMMGSSVMAVFSVIFLFYTNSFLMKRRRKPGISSNRPDNLLMPFSIQQPRRS